MVKDRVISIEDRERFEFPILVSHWSKRSFKHRPMTIIVEMLQSSKDSVLILAIFLLVGEMAKNIG